jgi:hypothetical protein
MPGASRAAYYGDKPVLSDAVKAVAVADQVALTAAAAAGANPTKAEFDKVVADAVAARTTLNALLARLRTAGLLAP